ncbi:MAG: CopG family antitoxin [Acidobacteriaceae bacterium]
MAEILSFLVETRGSVAAVTIQCNKLEHEDRRAGLYAIFIRIWPIYIDCGIVSASMQVMKKTIPKFRNEEEERNFWAKEDSTRYIDWSAGSARKFVQLKPSLCTISLTKNI